MNDEIASSDMLVGRMSAAAGMHDVTRTSGRFTGVCRDADGNILWEAAFDNLLTTAAKNFLLDTTLAGSSYTVVGPFMGLISSASFTAVAAADTMASHAGWLESGGANAPTMSSTRLTCVWSAASGGVKALSASLTFTFTGSGTVQGGFIVTGTGAVNTVASTAGTLYAAGVLGTPQPVIATNTLAMSYSSTLT